MMMRNLSVALAASVLVLMAVLTQIGGTTHSPGSAARGRAQILTRSCGTRSLTDRERDAVERATDQALQRLGLNGDRIVARALDLGTIHVAVHVIYYTSGQTDIGKLSQSTIQDQIDVLNQAYDNLTFVLDSVDYTNNLAWFNMSPDGPVELQAKTALQLDPTQYLNIYTAGDGNGDDLLGWSTFPWEFASNPELDGVVLNHESFPGGSAPYDEGDTAVHEIGHWCGLYHTFEGGCSILNDRVFDTPAESRATFGCPNRPNTCPGPGRDPIFNYMDYTNDACMFEFTNGQYNRMARMLSAYRGAVLQ